MMKMRWGGTLVCAWLMLCCAAVAQLAATTVSDTVYGADGRPAQGTLLISWPAFTAMDGTAVAGGSTAVTLGSKGSLRVALTPNTGSDPIGSYYTVQYHLSDGTVTRENWVVPAASTAVTLAAIRSTVMPLSVAMQTVSKTYVDRAIAQALKTTQTPASAAIDTNAFVQAAPTGAQTVTQPVVSGTQTYQFINALNGFKYASLFQTGGGNNGIANAFGTTAGQTVMAEPIYGAADSGPASYPNQSHLIDYRLGSQRDTFTNPGVRSGVTGYYPAQNSSSIFTDTQRHAALEDYAHWSGPSYDLGTSGTSAQSWTVGAMHHYTAVNNQAGIASLLEGDFDKTAIGDTIVSDMYLTAFGGSVAGADESVNGYYIHTFQRGFVSGAVTAGASSGSSMITVGSPTCTGKCDEAYSGNYFAVGGMLLDTHTAGVTATIATAGYDSTLNGRYYTLSGATVTPSTAWGNIQPASCTGNGNGQSVATTTCSVTLGAGSGDFNTSSHIYLAGPFQEEAVITAAPASSGGVQAITFQTRYAWDNANGNTNAALVMQGGPGGQALIQTGTLSTWPVAYQVLGATSTTKLYYANCKWGDCAGGSVSSNVIPNGSITLYPMAFITGTNLGQIGVAQLAANSINFATGDAVVGAPTSEYIQSAITAYYGQSTNAEQGSGLFLGDEGTTPQQAVIATTNFTGKTAPYWLYTQASVVGASYVDYFKLRERPTEAVISVGLDNNNPTTPYCIFKDDFGTGCFQFNPTGNRFSMPGLDVPSDFTTGTETYGNSGLHLYGGFGASHIDAITTHGASDITIYLKPLGTGTVDVSGAKITNVANGTVSTDAVAYGQVATVGRTGSASDIGSGTLADARLSGNVDLLNTAQTVTGAKTFTSLATVQATPASSSDACTAGQMWTDANFIYVCVAKNTIKRAALSSF
jgi:hypothetical protein